MALKVTNEGYLEYSDTTFFREGIFEYAGCELDPGGKRWGLEQKKLYNVYRPKSEVTKKEFVESCNAVPVRNDHPKQGGIGNRPDLERPNNNNCSGSTCSATAVGNELHCTIKIWDPKMIQAIKKGKRELSLGYESKIEKKQGMWNGKRYDFVQSELKAANHLALVDEARNGSDCRVVDSMFITDSKLQLEQPEMDFKTISADELVKGLAECSDECKAKAKEFLNTPTEDEKKAAEEAEKQKQEQAAKDAEAAKQKQEAEKKEAVDAAVATAKEEQKTADAAECEKACDAAAKKAVADYKAALTLANDSAVIFGTISMEGINNEAGVVKHICDMKISGDLKAEAVQKMLKDSKPESAIVALRGAIAGCDKQKTLKTNDSKTGTGKKSFAEYMKTR